MHFALLHPLTTLSLPLQALKISAPEEAMLSAQGLDPTCAVPTSNTPSNRARKIFTHVRVGQALSTQGTQSTTTMGSAATGTATRHCILHYQWWLPR